METHDFTAAKVGDKVSHPLYGNGKIININGIGDPIVVAFIDIHTSFNYNGKEYKEQGSSLYHGHNLFEIKVNPLVDPYPGEWILVRNFDNQSWTLREFVEFRDGKACCVNRVVDENEPFKWEYYSRLSDMDKILNNR